MLRTLLGIVAGLIVAVAVVALGEAAGHALFPPPADVGPMNSAKLAAMMGEIPFAAKVAVVIAWALGAFAGGLVAVRIARASWPAWAIGALILAISVWTMLILPHPLWMWAAAITFTAAAAYAAGALAPKA